MLRFLMVEGRSI